MKYLKKVPYDVLEVLNVIVRPVDVVEPRNLDQPPIVVAVDVVADCPGFESVQEHFDIFESMRTFWVIRQCSPVSELVPLCNRATIDGDSQLAVLILLLLKVREHLLDQLSKIPDILIFYFLCLVKYPTCPPRDCWSS